MLIKRGVLLLLFFCVINNLEITMKKIPASVQQHDSIKVDIKSRLGYYAEYVTAYELSKLIGAAGGKLSDRSNPNKLKSAMNTRHTELLASKAPTSEISRQESGGKAISGQIFSDLKLRGDIKALLFDIELTGDSAKGVGKADVVLTVTLPSKKQLIDKISASIKTYKTPNINLANSTFTSLLKALSGDAEYENKALSKFQKIIFSAMVDEYMTMNKIKNRSLAESVVGSGETFLKKIGQTKFNAIKAAGRKAAKASHNEVATTIIAEFNSLYEGNKKKINKNLLKLIGMDGEDDFYAAIGENNKQKVLSSRQSNEMKKFLESVKNNNLNIVMKPSTSGNSIDVRILIEDKEVAKSSISFTDTGVGSGGMKPSKATGKTNFWFNVKAFM